MAEVISRGAGLAIIGLLAGSISATIFVMGWVLYVIGAVALIALGLSLWLFALNGADYGYRHPATHRACWGAVISGFVLAIVVLFL